jgi:hypothetical protein
MVSDTQGVTLSALPPRNSSFGNLTLKPGHIATLTCNDPSLIEPVEANAYELGASGVRQRISRQVAHANHFGGACPFGRGQTSLIS